MRNFVLLIFILILTIACSRSQGVGKGQRIDFTDRLHLDRQAGQFAQVFIPDYYQASGNTFDLVFHLHSASWAAENEVYKCKANVILFNIHLGAFSSPYQSYFRETDRFKTILKLIRQTLVGRHVIADSASMRYLILTSFSAGYAGVREILKDESNYEQINALHLADGLHSNSDLATMEQQMKDFVRFARDAVAKEKIFRLTHSSIPTSGYKSTTETANYLLQKLGLHRKKVKLQDEIGQMYSRCDSGNFHLRAYLGDTAHDHLQHLYAMHLMLGATMQQLLHSTGLDRQAEQPADFSLGQNYPNPFNNVTAIPYVLERGQNIRILLYNLRGSLLATLLNKWERPGNHTIYFDAARLNLATGFYLVALQGDNARQLKKIIYLK